MQGSFEIEFCFHYILIPKARTRRVEVGKSGATSLR